MALLALTTGLSACSQPDSRDETGAYTLQTVSPTPERTNANSATTGRPKPLPVGNPTLVTPKGKGNNKACKTPGLKACDGGWGLISIKVEDDQYLGWLISGTVRNINAAADTGSLRVQIYDGKGKIMVSALAGALNTPKGEQEIVTFALTDPAQPDLTGWKRIKFTRYIGGE